MDIIHLLPENVANKIAAGEVVQRPSSVVKELMENSIDAGSTEIILIIKNAGKTLIEIVDNGTGMSETDARMSFERHATSKIKNAEDLFSIQTMGFRGEALASIAAVSRVELKTKRNDAQLGTHIIIEGSEFKSQEPCSIEGTQISVKNLFYNIPARRNFLKSNPVELKHISEEFIRLALSYPDLSFRYYSDEEIIYSLKSGSLQQRIIELFGDEYKTQLIYFEEVGQYMKLSGFIGKPENAKKIRGEQFFFVNKRFIRSPYLNNALTRGYETLIPSGSYPFFLINITIAPAHIDVNVHPSKSEIKFDDDKNAYSILFSSIRKAISSQYLIPEPVPGNTSQFGFQNFQPYPNKNLTHWESLYQPINPSTHQPINPSTHQPINPSTYQPINPSTHQQNLDLPFNQDKESKPLIDFPFQLSDTFIVYKLINNLSIIHIKRAIQRIVYDKLIRNYTTKLSQSKTLLFPQTLHLNKTELQLMDSCTPDLKSAGFDFSPFGNDTIIIYAIPEDLNENNLSDLFHSFLNDTENPIKKSSNDVQNKTLLRLAKHTATTWKPRLTNEEIIGLINQLGACSNANYTPDGELIIYQLSNEEIETKFNTKKSF